MIIANFKNNLIKVTTDLLPDALVDYETLEVNGNVNCCTSEGVEVNYSAIIDLNDTAWYLDLATPVDLETMLQKLQIQNLNTLSVFNVLTVPIDLSYVATNCMTEDCTLQTFSGYFAPLFKDAIDTWFAGNGIVSNVSVTFSGNVVVIDNLPSNFTMYNGEYGSAEPYTEVLFSASQTTNVYVLPDGIYISPEFFSLTSLMDGIYKISIKFKAADNSYIQETNCAFVDVTVKCKVASVLQNILKESKVSGLEESSTIIHILHYALTNGSNCGCNCEELCKVYTELVTLLNNIDPQITNDCGC